MGALGGLSDDCQRILHSSKTLVCFRCNVCEGCKVFVQFSIGHTNALKKLRETNSVNRSPGGNARK